ncbi:MAG: RNA-binding S4 domain-containing protein [Flavobacteriales bacterium]
MPSICFELREEFVELNQLLKLVGACNSGGEGKQLVAQGLVTLNGELETRRTCKVRSGDVVRYGDIVVEVNGPSGTA